MTLTTRPLRDVLEDRITQRWQQWAQSHPRLAEVIDRTRLVETTVASLDADPDVRAAFRESHVNEHQLREAIRVLRLIDNVVARSLPL